MVGALRRARSDWLFLLLIGVSAGTGAGFLAGRLAVIDRPADPAESGTPADLRPRMAAMEARLAAVEQRPDVLEALIALDADVVALRDAVHRELTAADRRIDGLVERISLMEEAVAAVGELAAGGSDLALDEDDVRYWVAQAADEDPGERFSALVVLGRGSGEAPVQASLQRLRDSGEEPLVVWQALRNLAHFRARRAAPEIAARLLDEDAVLRRAAHAALLALGAPMTEYDPLASDEARNDAAAELREWAERID